MKKSHVIIIIAAILLLFCCLISAGILWALSYFGTPQLPQDHNLNKKVIDSNVLGYDFSTDNDKQYIYYVKQSGNNYDILLYDTSSAQSSKIDQISFEKQASGVVVETFTDGKSLMIFEFFGTRHDYIVELKDRTVISKGDIYYPADFKSECNGGSQSLRTYFTSDGSNNAYQIGVYKFANDQTKYSYTPAKTGCQADESSEYQQIYSAPTCTDEKYSSFDSNVCEYSGGVKIHFVKYGICLDSCSSAGYLEYANGSIQVEALIFSGSKTIAASDKVFLITGYDKQLVVITQN